MITHRLIHSQYARPPGHCSQSVSYTHLSGETNYMAPASARQMASELTLLPMWYAEEGSVVLAPSAYNRCV